MAMAHPCWLVKLCCQKRADAVVARLRFRGQVCAVKSSFDDKVRLILIGCHVAPVAFVNVAKVAIEGVVQVFGQGDDPQRVRHAGAIVHDRLGNVGHEPELFTVELDKRIALNRQVEIGGQKITGVERVRDMTGQAQLVEVLLPPHTLQHQPPGLRLDGIVRIHIAKGATIHFDDGFEDLIVLEKGVDLVVAEIDLLGHGGPLLVIRLTACTSPVLRPVCPARITAIWSDVEQLDTLFPANRE